MPEPITLSIVTAATAAAGPALNGLAALTMALKEPGGKRKVEEMRKEFADSLDALRNVVSTYQDAISALESELEAQERAVRELQEWVAYLRLPFWKRWFTPKPDSSS